MNRSQRAAMQAALKALEASIDVPCYGGHPEQEAAAALLRSALAEAGRQSTEGELKMKIVVVGPFCWGAGDSLKSAVGKARINWPFAGRANPDIMPYKAYLASDDFQVNDYGHISAKELKRIREVRVVNGKKIVREGDKVLMD